VLVLVVLAGQKGTGILDLRTFLILGQAVQAVVVAKRVRTQTPLRKLQRKTWHESNGKTMQIFGHILMLYRLLHSTTLSFGSRLRQMT